MKFDNPVITRLRLPTDAALDALAATCEQRHGLYGTFIEATPASLVNGQAVLRVDQEGCEGLYFVTLKHDGTWTLSAPVVTGDADKEPV